jgi:hypothetical protein
MRWHLVGTGEHSRRDVEAERLCGLQLTKLPFHANGRLM